MKACSKLSDDKFLFPSDLFNSSWVIKPLWIPRPINLANDFVIILSTIKSSEDVYNANFKKIYVIFLIFN